MPPEWEAVFADVPPQPPLEPLSGRALRKLWKKMPKGKAAGVAARVSAAIRAVADALRTGEEGLSATLASDGNGAVVQTSPAAHAKFPGLPARVLAQTAIEKDMIVATTTCREAP
jgi:ADP-ribosylglycohydrolase